jgi:type II secretory ATPase GspE/PulE/Tfp pilus assembly ATPase PilB-like protein
MDLFVINNLITSDELKIEPIICSEASISKAINKYYYNQEAMMSFDSDEVVDWRDILNSEKQDENHLKNIIETILRQAIQEDVHELFFEHKTWGLSVILAGMRGRKQRWKCHPC